jgi:hypothetical protein
MSLTQIEKNIINALGQRGAMGVSTLIPLVDGLTSKAQLKNVLEEQQQNGQWSITRTEFKGLTDGGFLAGASKLPPSPSSQELQTPSPQPKKQPKAEPKVKTEKSAPQKAPAEEVLFKLMRTIPADITLQINSRGIAVNWHEQRYEPSLDELANVLDAIDTLQQHAA